jgi:hypothetical protein
VNNLISGALFSVMSAPRNRDDEDRKSIRRQIFNKKKSGPVPKESSDDLRIRNKIKNEFKSKKTDIVQDELWEDWEDELDKYK